MELPLVGVGSLNHLRPPETPFLVHRYQKEMQSGSARHSICSNKQKSIAGKLDTVVGSTLQPPVHTNNHERPRLTVADDRNFGTQPVQVPDRKSHCLSIDQESKVNGGM